MEGDLQKVLSEVLEGLDPSKFLSEDPELAELAAEVCQLSEGNVGLGQPILGPEKQLSRSTVHRTVAYFCVKMPCTSFQAKKAGFSPYAKMMVYQRSM